MIKKPQKKTKNKKRRIYILTIISYFLPIFFCIVLLPLIIVSPLILEEKTFYPLKPFSNISSENAKKTEEEKWIEILNSLEDNFNKVPDLETLQKLVKDYEDPLFGINLNGVDYNQLRQLPHSGKIKELQDLRYNNTELANYRNYIRLRTIGDGNCWWNALTILLVGKEDKEIATRLRVATALNIINNAEVFFTDDIYGSDKIIEKDRTDCQNNVQTWRFNKIKELIKDTRILEDGGWAVLPDIVGYVSYTIKKRIEIIFSQNSEFLINRFPPASNRKKKISYFLCPPFNIQYESKKLIKDLNKRFLEKNSLSWSPFTIYHNGVNHFEAMIPLPNFTNSQSKNKKKVKKIKEKK